MKKIICSVISLVIIFSMMTTTFAINDTAYQLTFDELTVNTKWVGSTSTYDFISSHGSKNVEREVVDESVDNAGYSIDVTKSGKYVRTYFGGYPQDNLAAGETYEFSARVKANHISSEDTSADAGKVRFGNFYTDVPGNGTHYNDAGVSNYDIALTDGWKKLVGSHTLTNTYLKVTPGVSGSHKDETCLVELNIDDIAIAKKYRAFFDDTVLANSGASAVGGTVTLDSSVNHVKEEGAALENSVLHTERTALTDKAVFTKPLNNFDTSSGKTYTIWAWVKVNELSAMSSGKVVLAVMDSSDASKYTMSEEFEVDNSGWTRLSLDYIMPEAGGDVIVPAGICVMQKSGDVITDLNIDDVTIVPYGTKAIFDTDEYVPENVTVTGGATSEISTNYHNKTSGRSLKVSGRTSLEDMISLLNPLSPDEYEYKKPYTVKISAMSPTAGTVVPFVSLENGVIYGDEYALSGHYWQEMSLNFVANSMPTAIGVVQKNGTVLSTIYVDDISVAQAKYYDENYVVKTSQDDAGNVNVNGKLKAEMAGYQITVKVLKAGKTIDDINNEGAVLASDTAVVDSDGSYNISIDCTNTVDVNSELIVVVDDLYYPDNTDFLYEKIVYTNPLAVDRILENVNGAEDGDALKSILTSGSVYDDIGLSSINLPELTNYDFVHDYIVALDEDFETSDDFIAAYRAGWLVGCFNEYTDKEVLSELISENEEILGLSAESTYTEVYAKLTDEEEAEIIDDIISKEATDGVKFADEKELVKFICDESIMVTVNNEINYSAKMEILIANAEYLNVDFSAYEELKSAGKKYVGTKLSEAIESTEDFADIEELLAEYIDDYEAEAAKSKKSSSGSGGGGGNKYVNATVEIPSTSQPSEGGADALGTNNGFADVADDHWASEAIEKLAQKGVINGYSDGSFKPENKVTRAEYVKMLVSMFNLTDNKAESNFADLSKDNWSYKYIASAEKLGIISGGGDGLFNPNDEITREDLVTISYRLFMQLGIEFPEINEKVYFVDRTQISAYAEEASTALQRAGIVNGVATENVDEYNFNPKHSASRAECAKILSGLLGYDW